MKLPENIRIDEITEVVGSQGICLVFSVMLGVTTVRRCIHTW